MGFLNISLSFGHSGSWYTWLNNFQLFEHPHYFWHCTFKKWGHKWTRAVPPGSYILKKQDWPPLLIDDATVNYQLFMYRLSMTHFVEHPLWISKSQAFLLFNSTDLGDIMWNTSPHYKCGKRKASQWPTTSYRSLSLFSKQAWSTLNKVLCEALQKKMN